MMVDSLFYSEEVSKNCVAEFRLSSAEPELTKENSRLLNEPLSGFFYLREAKDETTRSSITTRKTVEKILSDEELSEVAKKQGCTLEELKYDIAADNINVSYEGRPIKFRKRKNDNNGEYYLPATNNISDTSTSKETRIHTDDVKVPVLLREAEIRKINGMLPYTMEVSFRLRDDNGKLQDALVRYVLGIKTVLHLISIKDLSEDIREIVNGDIKTLRKVRYKSGELSFKDYLFDISNAKKTALNNVKTGKKWLNTLRRLAEYQKLKGTMFSKYAVMGTAFKATGDKGISSMQDQAHFPIPNGTIVLSQPEVMKLKSDTGIDLNTVSNAKRLAKSLFLIAVVIVDATAGTMRVLFTDSDNAWDIQSLSSIEQEVNKVDNKKLANELNHMINR